MFAYEIDVLINFVEQDVTIGEFAWVSSDWIVPGADAEQDERAGWRRSRTSARGSGCWLRSATAVPEDAAARLRWPGRRRYASARSAAYCPGYRDSAWRRQGRAWLEPGIDIIERDLGDEAALDIRQAGRAALGGGAGGLGDAREGVRRYRPPSLHRVRHREFVLLKPVPVTVSERLTVPLPLSVGSNARASPDRAAQAARSRACAPAGCCYRPMPGR